MARASSIDGLAKLQRKLARLKTAPRAPLVAALNAGADDLVRSMRRVAPVDKGALKASIRKEAGSSDLEVKVKAGGPLTTKAVRAGVKAHDVAQGLARVAAGGAAEKGVYDYANGVEFGHRTEGGEHVPADPFFFPTVRIKRKGVRRRCAKAVNDAIKAEAEGA